MINQFSSPNEIENKLNSKLISISESLKAKNKNNSNTPSIVASVDVLLQTSILEMISNNQNGVDKFTHKETIEKIRKLFLSLREKIKETKQQLVNSYKIEIENGNNLENVKREIIHVLKEKSEKLENLIGHNSEKIVKLKSALLQFKLLNEKFIKETDLKNEMNNTNSNLTINITLNTETQFECDKIIKILKKHQVEYEMGKEVVKSQLNNLIK